MLNASSPINEYIAFAHQTALDKGWWETPKSFAEDIALMHSELSEALEEYRTHGCDPNKMIYTNEEDDLKRAGWEYKPEGIAVELADVLIRIFDVCGYHEIPLVDALILKMGYNTTRPHRHGGKKL